MLTQKSTLTSRAMRNAKMASWEWDLTMNRFEYTSPLPALFGLKDETERLTMERILAFCIDRDVFLHEISRLIAYCESFADSATKGKSKIVPLRACKFQKVAKYPPHVIYNIYI
jgi:hypothetical protein